MTSLFLRVVFLNLIGLFGVSAYLGTLSAQETEDQSNVYVEKLKQARESQRETIRRISAGRPGNQFTQLSEEALKYYDYEIQNAEELIAEGGQFGKAEFDASLKVILEETRKSLERAKVGMAATSGIEEATRRFEEESRMLKEKHRATIDASNEKFRSTVDVANLRQKFSLSSGKIGIVLWNLPIDQALHRRSSLIVNVRLFNGKKSVWSRTGIRLHRKSARNPIRLPNVRFDRVTVEIPRWVGDGGGLSEVEVFLGEENVALGRPCEVSSIETLPIHLDDQHALTDGVTSPRRLGEGYWIPEAGAKSTVTVQLLGKKIESESTGDVGRPVTGAR